MKSKFLEKDKIVQIDSFVQYESVFLTGLSQSGMLYKLEIDFGHGQQSKWRLLCESPDVVVEKDVKNVMN